MAGHQYVFVRHDDEKHPHVHIAVKAVSDRTGERLNPRKADLQRWRETFAEKLNERGIDANATPTWARGNFNRGRRTRSYHAIKNKGELDKPRIKAPEHEEKNNIRMKALYEDVAKALAVTGSNNDKKMALDTVSFLKERTTLASSGNSKSIEPKDTPKKINAELGKNQTDKDKER
ncbi:relaxase/mobilization nuclease domain-containing protein [Iodobacter fluviatilis]|uniref:relaxase/mobilization nuclease domain-containing protein n=1 Tax=Iodobacter fluviatilis TaxID=537 RepID=UPI0021CD4065|nr:relaxase/mobilization nuclease domain-containing protein [Iodobacter fluviatilis]